MKNFKKVLALTLAVVMIMSTMTVAFAATNNDAKATVLKDLGLFKGTSSTEYVPDLDKESDAVQALVLIGRALQWEVDAAAATVEFTDVPAWGAPYVAYAVEMGITNGVSATEFGSTYINGQRVVAWFLRALGYDMTESWEDTATLAATAGIAIPTGTLRDDIVGVIYDGLLSTPVGGTATLIQMLIFGDSAKIAIAEAAGLIPATLSIVSAKAVGIKTVEVKLNKAVDTTKTVVQVKKGAATYGSAVVWNDAMNTATVTTVITLPEADYTAIVTVDGGTPIVQAFSVVKEASATINVTSKLLYDELDAAEVNFVVNNQYGEDMEIKANNKDLSVVAYNVTQKASVKIGKKLAEQYFTVNTLDNGVTPVTDPDYKLLPDDFELNDIVRFTVSYLGMTTQSNLTVMDASASDVIVFGDLILADEDATKLTVDPTDNPQLVYTLLDQYGEEIFLSANANADDIADEDGVTFVSSNTDVIADFEVVLNDDDEGELFLVMGDEDGTATITAVVNASGSVTTTSIVVAAASTPDSVEIAEPTMIVAAGDDAFDLEIIVTDQFGDVITNVDNLTFVGSSDHKKLDTTNATGSDTDEETIITVDLTNVVVSEDNGTESYTITAVYTDTKDTADLDDDEEFEIGEVTFDVEPNATVTEIKSASFATMFEVDGVVGADVTVDNDNLEIVDQYGREIDATDIIVVPEDQAVVTTAGAIITAKAVGKTTVTITASTIATDIVTTEDTYDVDVEVVDTADIDSYAMVEIGAMYAPDDAIAEYEVDVEINGVYNGKEVNLINSTPDIVTSSNLSVITVDETTVTAIDAGTSTISVWMDNVKVDSETVTTSDVAPYAVSVKWDATTITSAENADIASIIIVTDQYGVENYKDVVNLYFSVDKKGADSFTIAREKDSLGKFTGKYIVTGTGTSEVTVITSNGLSATDTITVK